MNKKTKILITVFIAIIILAGLIIALTKGFKVDDYYTSTKKLVITIDSQVEKNEIVDIVNEVIPVEGAQNVSIFKEAVAVNINDITDEQKQTLVDKLNEKYYSDKDEENNLDVTDILVFDTGKVRIRNILQPVILPISISTCVILVYFIFRYKLQNPYLVIIKTILSFAIVQVLFLSIVAIFRIPIGITTIPAMLEIFILTSLGLSVYFENNQKKITSTSSNERNAQSSKEVIQESN